MRRTTYPLGAKLFAILIAVITFLCGTASAISIYFCEVSDFYQGRGSYFDSSVCDDTISNYAHDILYGLATGKSEESLVNTYAYPKTNFAFELNSEDGSYHFATEMPEKIGTTQYISSYYVNDANDQPLTLTAYVADPIEGDDGFAFTYNLYQGLYDLRYVVIGVGFGSLVLFMLALSYLLCAAGHRSDSEEVLPNMQDKIPLDLYLAIVSVLAIPAFVITASAEPFYRVFSLVAVGLSASYACVLVLATLMTFATRLKLGKWWENTICFKVLHVVWRFLRGVWEFLGDLLSAIPTIWGVVVGWGILSMFYMATSYSLGSVFIVNCVLMLFFCAIAIQWQKLKKAGENLAGGNLKFKVNTMRMFPMFKRHGNNLNSLSQGAAIALEQQIKSERMKTELITNVSHDIKTPLTSILNYVDLMKKTEMDDQAKEYLAIVDKQSKRLKKLTEDLVEASKASTGNMNLNIVAADIYELTTQAVVEYDEKFEKAALQAFVNEPTSPLYGYVDGTLMWRVLSNLLSNACKYSQPNTRIYITIGNNDKYAYISIKNISEEQLNIAPEELMERFVRGDSSRSTEGSGLGLNIARSLLDLQKGKLVLNIDGDLYKATVFCPLAPVPVTPDEIMDAPITDAQQEEEQEQQEEV